jgi:hypothetical protein
LTLRAGAGRGLDTIDWEGIALQASLTLYDEGHRVTRSPRGWLRAVIRHLVCQSVRRESFHLAHARIDHFARRLTGTSDGGPGY